MVVLYGFLQVEHSQCKDTFFFLCFKPGFTLKKNQNQTLEILVKEVDSSKGEGDKDFMPDP